MPASEPINLKCHGKTIKFLIVWKVTKIYYFQRIQSMKFCSIQTHPVSSFLIETFIYLHLTCCLFRIILHNLTGVIEEQKNNWEIIRSTKFFV